MSVGGSAGPTAFVGVAIEAVVGAFAGVLMSFTVSLSSGFFVFTVCCCCSANSISLSSFLFCSRRRAANSSRSFSMRAFHSSTWRRRSPPWGGSSPLPRARIFWRVAVSSAISLVSWLMSSSTFFAYSSSISGSTGTCSAGISRRGRTGPCSSSCGRGRVIPAPIGDEPIVLQSFDDEAMAEIGSSATTKGE